MPGYYPRIGDKIEVDKTHRLRGEKGTVVAIGDSTTAEINHFHIRFDRDVWGVINRREIWLGVTDFIVTECAPETGVK